MSISYYSAGNFEMLKSQDAESRFKDKHQKVYGNGYNRLTSFFFKKESAVVLGVNDNVKEGENAV